MAADSPDRVTAFVVFGDHRRVSRASRFGGGTLIAVFEVTIVVPRGWVANVGGASVFGEFEDKTTAEGSRGDEAPRVTVRGLSLGGDVTVRHAD